MRDKVCRASAEPLKFPRSAAARPEETRIPKRFHLQVVTGGARGNNCLYNAFRRAILEAGVVPRRRPFDYTVGNTEFRERFSKHISDARTRHRVINGGWGESNELQYLSQVFGVHIHVWVSTEQYWQRFLLDYYEDDRLQLPPGIDPGRYPRIYIQSDERTHFNALRPEF